MQKHDCAYPKSLKSYLSLPLENSQLVSAKHVDATHNKNARQMPNFMMESKGVTVQCRDQGQQ